MIVLDTNIISELMRPRPAAAVMAWVNTQPQNTLYLSSVTVAELAYGVAKLPDGLRKTNYSIQLEQFFQVDFSGRFLSFDVESALIYAQLVAARDALGRPISQYDAQIAAICLRHNARLATRNSKDFDNLSLILCNPFDDFIAEEKHNTP